MKIDISTIHSAAGIRASSDRQESITPTRPASADSWAEFANVVRSEISQTNSSIVSISDQARIAAQTADQLTQYQAENAQGMVDAMNKLNTGPQHDLNAMMLDLLSGRKILGISASDLQALHSSDANSGVQLKATEEAARRAGFALPDKVPQPRNTVDQGTFQSRGVIRGAHGK